jgi:hypothetical protein
MPKNMSEKVQIHEQKHYNQFDEYVCHLFCYKSNLCYFSNNDNVSLLTP